MTTPRKFHGLSPSKFPSGTVGAARKLNREWFGANTLRVVPHVEEWPFASDDNGQAYPAGTVGVRFTYTSQRGADLVSFNNAGLVAVPSVLPAGYTHRWKRDHNLGPVFATSPGRKGMCNPPLTYSADLAQTVYGWKDSDASSVYRTNLREGNTLYPYSWMPECIAQQCIVADQGSNALRWAGAPLTGLRYFRIQDGGAWSTASGGMWLRIRVSRNADGSQGSSGTFGSIATGGTYGDTIVYESTVFVPAGSTGVAGDKADSGWHAADNLALNARAFYCFSYDTYFQNPAAGTPTEAQWTAVPPPNGPIVSLGYRCDVPFPWTFTGLDAGGGHIIAPGGVVTGVIPGYP